MSTKTVYTTLHKDLKLQIVGKGLLPELIDKEMKKERVMKFQVFVAMIAAVP
jgi:hypothetical protein